MTPGALVIVRGAGESASLEIPPALGEVRVVAADEHPTVAALALAADVARADVLWLPPWTVLVPEVVAGIVGWRSRPAATTGPRVARARLELRCDGATIARRTPQVVLSAPGSVDLDGELPRPRAGAQVDDLAPPWPARLPVDLRAHLEAVNQQSSAAARLRTGCDAPWRALLLTPLVATLRDLTRVRGSRRAALPRLVIESYREVLVAAKLWERAHDHASA